MSPEIIISCLILYFLLIGVVSFLTSKEDNNKIFFSGNNSSPWFLVAFGMIGTSLSGITFISVPGLVQSSNFSYIQMVFGYLAGYLFIARVLLPMYYKMGLVSIYEYLKNRLGLFSYKTGAIFFILSRTIGASFRLYIVSNILHLTIFQKWGFSYFFTIFITIFLIWIYTYRAGIKTIVWTDTLQTFFMLSSVIMTIYLISKNLSLNFSDIPSFIFNNENSRIFHWEGPNNFFKQFFSGAFIAIAMTGLDQDMMQKNLSCKNLEECQKNIFYFSTILVLVNLLFLSLGILLYTYANKYGIYFEKADDLFVSVAMDNNLGPFVGILFFIGVISAAYSSADSAITALTTSFCVDILNMNKNKSSKGLRKIIHIFFSLLIGVFVFIIQRIGGDSIIVGLFKVAGFTYGPLLGLYGFGLFTKYGIKDKIVPYVCTLSVIFCYLIEQYLKIGFEILIINGFITFTGLYLIRIKNKV